MPSFVSRAFRQRWIGLTFVLGLCLLRPSPALQAAAPSDQIDALLGRYLALGLFNGTALVADHGQVVLKKGYGLANMEWNIPNAPDTKFRLGSITKQFTATLVMQWVEQGQIDLKAPLKRYLPEYPSPVGDKVTIHHLLNHTSGIPGYTELPGFGAISRTAFTPTQFAEATFAKLDLLFEPGEKYSYNNSGYFLLGMILERVTGKSYETLLRERIFTPLGMNDSGYDSTHPLLTKRAAGYDKRFDGSFTNTSYLDMTQPYAAGSLYSTVEDLYRWDQALYTDTVLSAASKERMFTPGLGEYGYAFRIHPTSGGTTVEHGGGINGFNTIIVRDLQSKRLILLLNNTGPAPLDEMAAGARAILEGKPAPMPKRPGATTLYETYQASGLAAMTARAKQLAAGSEYDAGVGELMRVGDQLLATGKRADALTLATAIMEQAPKSAPAAVLLARAHRANGHRIEAVQAYSRAIELSDTPRTFLTYTNAIRELSAVEPKNKQ